jgi:hypothetical protein
MSSDKINNGPFKGWSSLDLSKVVCIGEGHIGLGKGGNPKRSKVISIGRKVNLMTVSLYQHARGVMEGHVDRAEPGRPPLLYEEAQTGKVLTLMTKQGKMKGTGWSAH